MSTAALIILAMASVWLITVAGLMLFAPSRALAMLRLTAASRTVNNVEQGLRLVVGAAPVDYRSTGRTLVVGAALVVRAPASLFPLAFEVAGWFVVASSIALLVMPLRWHSSYARWWADRLGPRSVQALAPFSAAAGLALLYAAR